jgi:hypothetical protein
MNFPSANGSSARCQAACKVKGIKAIIPRTEAREQIFGRDVAVNFGEGLDALEHACYVPFGGLGKAASETQKKEGKEKNAMEMPKLTPAHAKLNKLVGNWTAEERLWPSPWMPEGGAAVGRVANRLALDGFAIVQDYEQEQKGVVNLRGLAIIRWDADEQCYIFSWLDSLGMPPNDFKGDFTDDVLTVINHSAQGHTRATFDFRDEGVYHYRMEVSPDGANWLPFITADYFRQSS